MLLRSNAHPVAFRLHRVKLLLMTQSSTPVLRRFSRAEMTLLALIVALYFLLLGHFRTFSIDDAWFASFTYDFWNHGIATDTLYQRRFPHGMGGVEAFGKLAAFVQAPLMNATGWSLRGLEVLSTAFVAGALALLADICRRLGRSPHFTLCVLAIAGLPEPFVVTAEGTRFEFLTVFLLILGLWCAVRGWAFPAAFAGYVGVEVEPSAVVVALGVSIVLLMMASTHRERLRRLPWMALAAVCAVGVYFALHPHAVSTFRTADWTAVDASEATHGFVFFYLFTYKRHLPELLALVGAIVVTLRSRRHLLKEWPAIALAAVTVASVVIKWGNPRYFILLMPFFALFVTGAFFTERRWKLMVAVTIAVMLPQYAYRYYLTVRQAPALTAADQRTIAAAIDRAAASEGIQDADARVLGDSNVWFAHPDGFLALDRRVLLPTTTATADVVVCFEKKLDPVLQENSSEVKCSELTGLQRSPERLTVHGYAMEVFPATGQTVGASLPEWMQRYLKSHTVQR